MYPLIIALVALFLIALTLGAARNWWYQRKVDRGEIEQMPGIQRPEDMECCGQHEICEKESLLAAVSKEIEYYEDEHLDAYRGRPADSYSCEEVEEFQEVLFTMHNDEVAGWMRSLTLRGIELPVQLKDDVIMIVEERRNSGHR